MRQLIDNALLKACERADRPYEIRDTRLRGFLLRVETTGRKTFYLEYGRGKRVKLGIAGAEPPALSPARARLKADEIRGAVARSEDPVEERRRAKADTLRIFIDEHYDPWAKGNIRTAKATVARLKTSFAELLDKKLGDITPWLIEKWRKTRVENGAKASSVNRELDDLRSSLNKAVAWNRLESNPATKVKRSRHDAMRAPRFLSRDEEDRLRQALEARQERARAGRDSANRWRAERGYDLLPDLRERAFIDRLAPLVLLSLHTGMRRGELFSLTWRDVDTSLSLVTIRGLKAKSGTTRHVPLNLEASAALEGWRLQTARGDGLQLSSDTAEAAKQLDRWHGESADAGRLLFPSADGVALNNVRRSWGGVLKAARINRLRWHDLRHTFASNLVMAGASLNTVRDLLGHSDYKMTLRYAHLAPDHKAAAVAKLVRK